MLRVLVVDDSQVARRLLVAILDGEPDIEVVGEAVNGLEAVQKVAELKPDVVTMDVQMPRMDGYAATREIMMTHPTPIVIVSGSTGQADVDKSLHSLDAGALTVIAKPPSPTSVNFEAAAGLLLQTVRSMAAVRVIRRHRPRDSVSTAGTDTSPSSAETLWPRSRPRIVTIGASTGGPQALRTILSSLPAGFPLPIVVVQHISNGFTAGLADWLERAVKLPVSLAQKGVMPEAGHVYLAPDGIHCGMKADGCLELISSAPLGGFQPSATVLFRTAAEAYGNSHIAVVLTGMGSDGVEGLRHVRQTHGFIIAQDKESSVVYGMPKVAADAGLTDQILPLERIGPELCRLANFRRN